MTIHDLDTPAIVCDLDITERNLKAMQKACDDAGVDLRPHIKTHKTPEFARWQLDLGAVGLTVAKLGEAVVMHEQAGCDDIFIAYSLIGEQKMKRLAALLDKATVRVSVVSAEQAEMLSRGLGGKPVKVRLNIETGLGRDGMAPDSAVETGARINDMPGLEVVGVFSHEGHAHYGKDAEDVLAIGRRAVDQLTETAAALRDKGVPCTEIAPGATPTAAGIASYDGVTEVRPGTYIFYDAMCMERMNLTPDDCAVRIITTVVDLPTPDRVIVDGGSKTFFADKTETWGRAYCIEHPELHLHKCSEEHGHGEWTGSGSAPFKLGDRLTWIPAHVCPVVNLFDELTGVRGEQVERSFTVAARGKVR